MVSNNQDLHETATWAVALVSMFFILISLGLEKIIHKMETWLDKRNKITLLEVLQKVKAELMILGFISLLLNFAESSIVKICVPAYMAGKMLPCSYREKVNEHRYLAENATPDQCKEGFEPLISVHGLHQLHILIFILAVLHVGYSAAAVLLGKLKIRGWKAWEAEISSHGYQSANCMTKLVRHCATSWAKTPIFYIICFFRQFYGSVSKAEYQSLRDDFIAVHLSRGSTFNFQEQIKKSLEDDFKVVVGISPLLWAFFVVSLLSNVDRWDAMFWTSLITLVIILAVNTNLEAILSTMSLEIRERHGVIPRNPHILGSDKYFWFGKHRLVLYLIHFSLFESAFQIAYCVWLWSSFGRIKCLNADIKPSIFKIALGVGMVYICSYVSLPLYALVTQTGSRRKRSTSDELGESSVGTMKGSTTSHSSGSISADDHHDGFQTEIELSPVGIGASPTSAALTKYLWSTRLFNSNEVCEYESPDEGFVDEKLQALEATKNNDPGSMDEPEDVV